MSYEQMRDLLIQDEQTMMMTTELVGFRTFMMDTVPRDAWGYLIEHTDAKFTSGLIIEAFPEHVLKEYVARYEVEKEMK